ncbi:hypothetical protein CDL15_Pgr001769 [Punica granatum]|uniref:Uncharacterized protein n=1 Tax=Punica granatum TaxID=22663 RepID=A0A218XAC7_PUNGR|nr:hypothetical protein CDL15_Pgr001769 [Punica granatum]
MSSFVGPITSRSSPISLGSYSLSCYDCGSSEVPLLPDTLRREDYFEVGMLYGCLSIVMMSSVWNYREVTSRGHGGMVMEKDVKQVVEFNVGNKTIARYDDTNDRTTVYVESIVSTWGL